MNFTESQKDHYIKQGIQFIKNPLQEQTDIGKGIADMHRELRERQSRRLEKPNTIADLFREVEEDSFPEPIESISDKLFDRKIEYRKLTEFQDDEFVKCYYYVCWPDHNRAIVVRHNEHNNSFTFIDPQYRMVLESVPIELIVALNKDLEK